MSLLAARSTDLRHSLHPRLLGVECDDHVIEWLTAARTVDPVSDVPRRRRPLHTEQGPYAWLAIGGWSTGL